jgi:hypothetical protein
MREPDPLSALLREWKSPEPSPELDRRIAAAYRDAVPRPPIWRRFFQARVSVPVPVFAVGVLLVLAVFVWFRESSAPQALPATSDLVTRLNATGFQPLPNGEARVISVKELKK